MAANYLLYKKTKIIEKEAGVGPLNNTIIQCGSGLFFPFANPEKRHVL